MASSSYTIADAQKFQPCGSKNKKPFLVHGKMQGYTMLLKRNLEYSMPVFMGENAIIIPHNHKMDKAIKLWMKISIVG